MLSFGRFVDTYDCRLIEIYVQDEKVGFKDQAFRNIYRVEDRTNVQK